MKCISICCRYIGSGRVFKPTDRQTTSDLAILDSDILDLVSCPFMELVSYDAKHMGLT